MSAWLGWNIETYAISGLLCSWSRGGRVWALCSGDADATRLFGVAGTPAAPRVALRSRLSTRWAVAGGLMTEEAAADFDLGKATVTSSALRLGYKAPPSAMSRLFSPHQHLPAVLSVPDPA